METNDEEYNEVTEWMRMRDIIDDAEIKLKGICQWVDAKIAEEKIMIACRELQDIIFRYHKLGD